MQGKHVTALALNSTRKLVAFSEYGERPLLIVYDLGRVQQERRGYSCWILAEDRKKYIGLRIRLFF